MRVRSKLTVGVFFVALVLFVGFFAVIAQDEVCGDEAPRVFVVSAFGAELEQLLAATEVESQCMLLGHEFTVGRLAGNDVVLALSGVSMTNAAMYTQAALDHFNITHIVFSGIAGGVNPALHIGDVTIPENWARYQEMLAAREVGEGEYDIAWHSADYENFEFWFPQTTSVARKSVPGVEEEMFWFAVDPEMFAVAQSISGFDLANCTADGTCLTYDPQLVIGGNGVSGSTFVDNARYRDWVWSTFAAQALDMETSAVAMVAYTNEVPYIAFRSLSDLAGGGEGQNEIGTFFQLAADNSASVVQAFLVAWANR